MTEATCQRKPSLYLAGPMRTIPFYNFPAFDSHRDHLRSLGWYVVSPADIDRAAGFEATALPADYDWCIVPEAAGTLDEIMLRDIEALETCEAIFMMRGWEESSGANRELAEARKLGLREFYEDVCASPSPSVMTPNREIVDMQTGETRTVDSSGERVFEDDGIGKCVRHLYDIAQQFDTPCGIPEPMGETRITDPVTGGQKGSKPAMFALIPSESLWELAELYGYGAAKYDPDNWRKGYSWRLSFSALMRHLWAFWRGEDRDPESGFKHLTHAAWHCLTLAWFLDNRRSHDDRPKAETQA